MLSVTSYFTFSIYIYVFYLSNFCLPVPLPSLSLPRYSPISLLEFPSLSLSLFSIKSPHHRRLLPCFTNSRTSRVPLRAVCFVRQREILKMRCSKADSISPLGYFSSISHFWICFSSEPQKCSNACKNATSQPAGRALTLTRTRSRPCSLLLARLFSLFDSLIRCLWYFFVIVIIWIHRSL